MEESLIVITSLKNKGYEWGFCSGAMEEPFGTFQWSFLNVKNIFII